MTGNQTIRNRIRARLIEKGMSLDSWARAHGYLEGVVPSTVSRYCGKDKRPIGKQAREIIEALEAETGVKICG